MNTLTGLMAEHRIKSNLAFGVYRVTPTLAKQLLEHNRGNRPIRESVVQQYARDIACGKWALTGQPILIDTDYSLRNGQHTLNAVIRSNRTIEVAIVLGMDPKAFENIDRNKPRNFTDVLHIKGEKSTFLLRAMLSIVAVMDLGSWSDFASDRPSWTHEELSECLRKHPDLPTYVVSSPMTTNITRIRPAMYCAFHYLFDQRENKERVRAFFDIMRSGENLTPGNPILTYRNRLIADAARSRQRKPSEDIALLIKTWNAYVRGLAPKSLVWTSLRSELFPNPIFGVPRSRWEPEWDWEPTIEATLPEEWAS